MNHLKPLDQPIRKIFLCGRSEAGKTTLTQAIKGVDTIYDKTQYVNSWDVTIDTPGEYYEVKSLTMKALYCFSFESDLEGLVCAADEPFNILVPGLPTCLNRPLIGIITKIHAPKANIPMVRQWLNDAGCSRIFEVDSKTGEGIEELRAYLARPNPEKISIQEAIARQNQALSEW